LPRTSEDVLATTPSDNNTSSHGVAAESATTISGSLDFDYSGFQSWFDQEKFHPATPLLGDNLMQSDSSTFYPSDYTLQKLQNTQPSLKSAAICTDANEQTKKRLEGLFNLLGSFPTPPASAAEYSQAGAASSSFSSISVTATDSHLTTFTITCSCSNQGTQQAQVAVTSGHPTAGGKCDKDILTRPQQPCKGDCKQLACGTGSAKRSPTRQLAKGSKSGFVFVFLLGAVSALCWFLMLRGMWWAVHRTYSVIL
jgi:hypothetical protein